MAMEIVPTAFLAQKSAEQSLLKILSNTQPQQARIQSVSKLTSGETQIKLSASGQTLDLKIDSQAATQVKPGTTVLLQAIQTPDGPRLAISPPSPEASTQNQPAAPEKGSLANQTPPPSNTQPAQQPVAKSGAEPAVSMRPAAITSQSSAPNTQRGPYSATQVAAQSVASALSASGNAPPQEALIALQRQALSQQRSLTDLFANLTAFIQQVETGQRPTTSKDIETAMRWLLGFQLSPKQQSGTASAKTALRNIMTSLGTLGQLTTGQGAENFSTNLKASLTLLQALLPKETAPARLPTMGTQRDHPPLPNTPLHGQSPRPSSISPTDSNSLALARIKGDVEAALARVTLSQIASARSTFSSSSAAPHPMQALHTEIPVMLANGTAIVQMIVEHDPDMPEEDEREQENSDEARRQRGGWTVRFAIDTNTIGPVDISLKLHQQSLIVTLAAEREQTEALFQEAAPMLQTMLEQEGLLLEGLSFVRKKKTDTELTDSGIGTHLQRLDRKL
ncbi:flagellar hook-length control protein FliK [Cohaesibacter marisflavi]|uniref:flagellar hook-length control protein FliK n=1 Tax=Cohaesibacter marisflavi TaxID=655353 RepID=UPI0029C69398|nr:flagellar hook-length control protein FliK [Cohaesibacter marisflavi]